MKKILSRIVGFALLALFLGAGTARAYSFSQLIAGPRGSGSGQFAIFKDETQSYTGPGPIRIADDGRIYIFDAALANNRIEVFDADGAFLSIIGGSPVFAEEVENPADAAFGSDGKLYVLENVKSAVYMFDGSGKMLSKQSIETERSLKIRLDKKNRIFVEDIKTGSLALYSRGLQLITRLGGEGSGLGRISCFELTNAGHLVVGLAGKDWRLSAFLVGEAGQLSPVKEIVLKNTYPGELMGFQLVRVDDFGHIYIRSFDRATHEPVVQRYNASGNVIQEYKLPANAWPVEVDPKGNVFFGQTDENEFRVMKVVQ